MSLFVEFIGFRLEHVSGLVEERAEWGGEAYSYDPPRYRYDVLPLKIAPVAHHVAAAMPKPLDAERLCLELDESVVLRWAHNDLDDRERQALTRLFVGYRAADAWACVCDATNGESTRIESCTPEMLLEAVGHALTRVGLAVFVVRPGTPV